MRRQIKSINLILLISVCLPWDHSPAWAQEPAGVVRDLQSELAKLDKELVSALAIGRLRQETNKTNDRTLVEQDVQIFYDAPKFRVHLIDPGSAPNAGQAVNAFEQDNPSEMPEKDRTNRVAEATITTERLVIFDGEVVYSIVASNGRQRGKVHFAFQQQAVLRTAGYPYVPPLQLWQAGFSSQLDPQKLKVQKLNRSGMILNDVNSAYTTKYYFFDDFQFDLRRIIFTVPQATQPFREISLQWGESKGVHFVTRYASRERTFESPPDPKVVSRDVEIEFSRFDANVSIAPQVFTLASLNLPLGTPFDDHRANVDGQPKPLKWDGEKLVDRE